MHVKEISGTAPPMRGTNGFTSHPLFACGLALGWSWLFWMTAVVMGINFESTAGIVLGLLGLLGPMVAGMTGTYLTYGKEGRRDYWRRVVDWKRIGARWYIVIFLLVPVLMGLAGALDTLLGGSGASWGEPAVEFWARPWTIIPFVLTTFFVGPMEEFGWRGYVLDRLQERWRPLTASLILGVIWSVWHLPLFLIEGTYQYNLGIGSPAFWLFMVGIVPLNVVFTWVYNNTGRSILAAMLLHFMINFTGEMVDTSMRAEGFYIGLWIVAATVVSVMLGAKKAPS